MKKYKIFCGCGRTFAFTQNEICNKNDRQLKEFVICPECETILDLDSWNYQEIEGTGFG